MKSFYNLRCFEYQYEQSNPFQLKPTIGTRISPTKTERVTSRLLSYPTKVYLYADFADSDQHPYGLGNVRRSCLLKNIHCRVNQRPDIIFNPSQEECYQMFRRHTNSSLEYGAWLKAPIYVFDPVDLGQPDFLANDARLSLMEWDAEVSLTPLQMQEIIDLKLPDAILHEGYHRNQFDTARFIAEGAITYVEFAVMWNYDAGGAQDYDPGRTNYTINMLAEQDEKDEKCPFETADSQPMIGKSLQFWDNPYGNTIVCPTAEIIKLTTVTETTHILRGFIWAAVDMTNGTVRANTLFYVPTSLQFQVANGNPPGINPWTALTTTVVAGNPETYTYAVDHTTIIAFKGTVVGGNNAATTFNDQTTGSQHAIPGLRSFQTNRQGVKNNNTADSLPPPAGINAPGQYYPVIDQRNSDDLMWCCFRPSDAMSAYNSTHVDKKVIRWTHDRPARNQVADAIVPTGKANYCLKVTGACKRDQVIAQAPVAHPNLKWDVNTRTSFPMYNVTMHDTHTHAFDYTLKALYEYGNCQYQFTSDGAPTRVLPNLVPVRDSSAIPIV